MRREASKRQRFGNLQGRCCCHLDDALQGSIHCCGCPLQRTAPHNILHTTPPAHTLKLLVVSPASLEVCQWIQVIPILTFKQQIALLKSVQIAPTTSFTQLLLTHTQAVTIAATRFSKPERIASIGAVAARRKPEVAGRLHHACHMAAAGLAQHTFWLLSLAKTLLLAKVWQHAGRRTPDH